MRRNGERGEIHVGLGRKTRRDHGEDLGVDGTIILKQIFLLLYAFFCVITRRLDFICRRFGTLCLFHLHRQVDVSRMKLG